MTHEYIRALSAENQRLRSVLLSVDTLLELLMPENGEKASDGEIASLFNAVRDEVFDTINGVN